MKWRPGLLVALGVGICLLPGCLRLFKEDAGAGGEGPVLPREPQEDKGHNPGRPGPVRTDYHLWPPPPPTEELPTLPGSPEPSEPTGSDRDQPTDRGALPPAHEVKSADGQGALAVVRATGNVPEQETVPEPSVAALRHLLANQPEEARAVLREAQCQDPELLLALLSVAGPLGKEGERRWTPDDAAALLDRLDALAEVLATRAPLVVEKACFCRHINTFGVYEPLPPAPCFQAGVNGRPGERVQVYVQVRNFTSEKKGEQYETRLASTLEVLDPSREVVARMAFPAVVDRSRSRRRDYFINFRFHIPPRLPSGRYTLRVQVRDAAAQAHHGCAPRTSHCSLDFTVH